MSALIDGTAAEEEDVTDTLQRVISAGKKGRANIVTSVGGFPIKIKEKDHIRESAFGSPMPIIRSTMSYKSINLLHQETGK